MGKNIIQQARGKGSLRYRSPSFRFKGKVALPPRGVTEGRVRDILDCPGHHAPLMHVEYPDGRASLMVAPEGIMVGAMIYSNPEMIERGHVLSLADIPTGVPVYNIESKPGDGGKFCRTSGTAAKIVAKHEDRIIVQLPSKKNRSFHPHCRANIGVVAGAGRPEKPFIKAGKKHFQMKAKNKLYPRSSACAMNAVDHPYGNKRSSRKAKQKPVNRFAPPGAKVGKLWPKRTGKRK
ncbi:50S ribosomal protein L2 [Candidatus Woesearchaeota archaeon]|nr:50S ribosomal protein L2 [Candidatus Woesearchaeota archaeon]